MAGLVPMRRNSLEEAKEKGRAFALEKKTSVLLCQEAASGSPKDRDKTKDYVIVYDGGKLKEYFSSRHKLGFKEEYVYRFHAVAMADWCWLSPKNILHACHPIVNSRTACGRDLDGYNYRPNADTTKFSLCKRCKIRVKKEEA